MDRSLPLAGFVIGSLIVASGVYGSTAAARPDAGPGCNSAVSIGGLPVVQQPVRVSEPQPVSPPEPVSEPQPVSEPCSVSPPDQISPPDQVSPPDEISPTH